MERTIRRRLFAQGRKRYHDRVELKANRRSVPPYDEGERGLYGTDACLEIAAENCCTLFGA
jgi:hypothetical protein